MEKLELPKTQKAEMLYELLTKENITFKSIYLETGIINLGARLSDLRLDHDLILPCVWVETYNKHNRLIRYGSWKLVNKELGLQVYKKINKE